MAKTWVRQHEPIRVPDNWSGQERAFAIQLNRIFDDVYSRIGQIYQVKVGSGDPVTSLDQIRIGTWGMVSFDSTTSPTETAASFNTLCFGKDEDNKTLLAFADDSAYFNTKDDEEWQGWVSFTVTQGE